jgi:PEP-CTERM motif
LPATYCGQVTNAEEKLTMVDRSCLAPRTSLKSFRTLAIAAVGALFLFVGTASALPTIDFNIIAPTAGVVAYGGGATPLFGLGISVDFVTGTNTPANSGSFACIDCALNFATGNFIAAAPNAWVFAGALGTSFLSITGSVDTTGDGVADIGPSVLLLGSFAGPQISVDFLAGSPAAIGLSTGMFLDIKNEELAAFFGLPTSPYSGSLTLGWTGLGDPGTGILATPTDGTVGNTFVPEPGTILLLGAALLGLAARQRKRSR